MSRFDFIPFTEEGRLTFRDVLDEMVNVEQAIEKLPDGREKSLALTKLEEAVHWVCMAIVRTATIAIPPEAYLTHKEIQARKETTTDE